MKLNKRHFDFLRKIIKYDVDIEKECECVGIAFMGFSLIVIGGICSSTISLIIEFSLSNLIYFLIFSGILILLSHIKIYEKLLYLFPSLFVLNALINIRKNLLVSKNSRYCRYNNDTFEFTLNTLKSIQHPNKDQIIIDLLETPELARIPEISNLFKDWFSKIENNRINKQIQYIDKENAILNRPELLMGKMENTLWFGLGCILINTPLALLGDSIWDIFKLSNISYTLFGGFVLLFKVSVINLMKGKYNPIFTYFLLKTGILKNHIRKFYSDENDANMIYEKIKDSPKLIYLWIMTANQSMFYEPLEMEKMKKLFDLNLKESNSSDKNQEWLKSKVLSLIHRNCPLEHELAYQELQENINDKELGKMYLDSFKGTPYTLYLKQKDS